jgi:hypothetical protein
MARRATAGIGRWIGTLTLSESRSESRRESQKESLSRSPREVAKSMAEPKERWHEFVVWCRRRPFIGGLLMVLAGIEMFFSGQLTVGTMRVQVGIEGFQATIIPIVLALVGVLATLMPQHRIFYGVIGLVVAVYSLVGVNLGGFFVGMVLAAVGGVLIVSWMPRKTGDTQPAEGGGAQETDAEAMATESDADAFVPTDADAVAPTDADAGASTDAGTATPLADDDGSAPAATGRRRRQGAARRTTGGTLALALAAVVTLGLTAAHPQQASAAESSGVCVLGFLGDCSTPAPTPSPTSSGSSSSTPSPAPSGGAGASDGTATAPAPTAPVPTGPQLIAPAAQSPVFTGKPALLQGSSLSFSGLRYLGLATVRLSDGSTATVLKLSMDSVKIPGFRLDTRDATGAGTDTVATSMSFSGGVDTYCSSLKGVLDNGSAVQYDIQHPPSSDGSVPVVRILSLEVFGITGGRSALTGFHEIIS